MSKIYFLKFNINEKIHSIRSGEANLKKYLKKIVSGINDKTVIYYDEEKNEVIEYLSMKNILKKDKDLMDISSDQSVEEPDEDCSYYKFMSLDHTQKNGDEIISGRVVRIYGDDWNRFFLDDTGKESLSDHHTPDKTVYVTFSFNVTKEIIGFSPELHFSKEKFMTIFKLLIEKTIPQIGGIELILLIDSRMLLSKFKKIDILTNFSVDFIPPNGSKNEVSDIIGGLYPYVEESNATKATIELKAPKKDPIDKSSKLVEGMLKMAKFAYAVIKGNGTSKDGDVIQIDTSDNKDIVLYSNIPKSSRDNISVLREETEEKTEYYYKIKREEIENNE
ncbi:hypothetical protein ADM98_08525 [Exiguobacterium sp. BMC-KP]|uniref:hypothetical protein n=1 Tax=Exiguobacterium sp. BMC-KP TaxID=1684312 RepID=UPI0006AA4B8A|nr:hypothetical protein [Exiguobacterium sp. BMC-KP]KOP28958.1 hypothetical protein ADM98_08525 [Exiguobacterium sp. BMC-KP]